MPPCNLSPLIALGSNKILLSPNSATNFAPLPLPPSVIPPPSPTSVLRAYVYPDPDVVIVTPVITPPVIINEPTAVSPETGASNVIVEVPSI